jgi:hypothetical protein
MLFQHHATVCNARSARHTTAAAAQTVLAATAWRLWQSSTVGGHCCRRNGLMRGEAALDTSMAGGERGSSQQQQGLRCVVAAISELDTGIRCITTQKDH